MRTIGLTAFATLLIAGTGATHETHQPGTPPLRVGVQDLSIGGPDETRENYIFSYVSGVAFDPKGRIVVTDMKDNMVRVFQSNGTFAYSFGRSGAGPGEFATALSGVFSPDGLFWVRDEGNRRWNAFELGPERAAFKTSVRYEHSRPSYRLDPVGFDAAGRLMSAGSIRDEKTGLSMPARFIIDRSGKLIRTDSIPNPPGDSIGNFAVTKEIKKDGRTTGVSTQYYYQPYGPRLAMAYAANGEIARAVTSRYEIEWRDASGKLLRRIRRNVAGPPLSAAEKKKGQTTIDDFLEFAQISAAQLPHGLPSRKAPIKDIAFDQLGRLWVDRAVADGGQLETDLYDESGKWIAVLKWPRQVRPLDYRIVGAQGNKVLGVASDSLDVEWVVRLRFE